MKPFVPSEKIEAGLLGLLVVAVIVWRMAMLPVYPFHEDETHTIRAMQSIVTTGLPAMDNGLLYWRALLAHYLMAVPLFFVPASEYSARLVPVLVSGAVLVLVWQMARRASGRMAAWVSVLFLAVSAYEQDQASFARFYMVFQFCFLLTVYCAGRYLIEGEENFGKWFFLALAATFGTHEMAVELLPVVLLALLIGRRFDLVRRPQFIWGSALVTTVAVLTVGIAMIFKPHWIYVNSLAVPLIPGGMSDKAFYYKMLLSYLPFGFSLILAGVVAVWTMERRIWQFYLGSFVVCLIGLTLVSPAELHRYMGNFFPLAVLVAALALQWLLLSGWEALSKKNWRQLILPMAGLILGAGHLVFAGDWQLGVAFGQKVASPDQRPAHMFLREQMNTGDILVSFEPGLSAIYLGAQADYFIRERFDAETRRFVPYTEREKQTLTFPVIDSPKIFAGLLAREKGRIWIYANHKYRFSVSKEMQSLIGQEFRVVYFKGSSAVMLREARH